MIILRDNSFGDAPYAIGAWGQPGRVASITWDGSNVSFKNVVFTWSDEPPAAPTVSDEP